MSQDGPAAAPPLDVRSLTEPVARSAVSAHARGLERLTGVRSHTSRFAIGCSLVVVLLIGVPTALVFGVLALQHGFVWAIAAVVVMIATVAICIRVIREAARERRDAPERRYRLERFAADNRLAYVASEPAPDHPGLLFALGQDGVAHDVIRWPSDGLEVSNHSSTTQGYRGIRTVSEWGCATAPLDHPAPALLLDGKHNRGAFDERLTALFDARTPTRLETRDGGRFELWTWPGDADVARRLFDDSLLSRLATRGIDLEIASGRVFLYSSRPLSTGDPELWTWLLETVRMVQVRVASL